jgi:hypothetical protein
LVLAPPMLMGCAELRTTYAPATGAPMEVFDQTVIRHGVQQVATGHSEVRDAQGNLIATSTHYENQPISWEERTWYPMQGRMRIDDESFYRITGDQEAVARYETWHHGGVTKNTIGWVMLGAGLAVLGGGIGMYAADQGNVNTTGATALSTVGYIGITAGIISAGVGAFLMVAGKHAAGAVDARLIDEPERMKADADNYNQQLAGSAPPPPAAAAAPAAPQGTPISIEPFTATMQGGRITRVELKADGGIWANGKMLAILSGSDVKDSSGTTLFSVFSDGTITGAGLGASLHVKIENDMLQMGGKQIALADDGTIVVINHGSAKTIGRISRGAHNRRTVTLVLFAVNTLSR